MSSISFLVGSLAFSVYSIWRRQWHPTPVLLPGKSHGLRSLVGCRPAYQSKRLHFHFSLSCVGEGNGNLVTLPRESQGRRNLVGCHLWGCVESDMTEVIQQQQPYVLSTDLNAGVTQYLTPQSLESSGEDGNQFNNLMNIVTN